MQDFKIRDYLMRVRTKGVQRGGGDGLSPLPGSLPLAKAYAKVKATIHLNQLNF